MNKKRLETLNKLAYKHFKASNKMSIYDLAEELIPCSECPLPEYCDSETFCSDALEEWVMEKEQN